MRVLHVVHQYLPDQVGGTELYTQWLAQSLRQRRDHVSVFFRRDAAGNGLDCWEDASGVRVCAAWSGRITPHRRFMATFGEKHLLLAFQQFVEQTQPDLVHIQHLMGLPVALVNHIIRRKLAFIITLHDYWWVCANAQLLTNYDQQLCDGPKAFLNCARCALARAGRSQHWPALPILAVPMAWRNHLLRQVLGAADWIIAPTGFVKHWYTVHGAPIDRLSVVPHGLDLPENRVEKGAKSEGPLRFAYIGGLSWQKGLHVLLEAFCGLHGAVELWIAGDESFDPTYVDHLRELATPQVRFLGRLTREVVWETLAQVDVVVVPSLWYETFSFIVSEAFVSGAPVVASQLGPLADRVRHEVDGLLVPPGDVAAWRYALQRLVDEPGLLERLRANVRPPLTLEQHVRQLRALYRSIVDARRGA